MAEILEVSRSGYYGWRSRPASARSRRAEELVREITVIQEDVKYRYGSPRVTEELKRRGYGVGENRVARLMVECNLGRRAKKRYRSTTDSNHRHAVAEDLSYVATAEGRQYLCVILDLYSR